MKGWLKQTFEDASLRVRASAKLHHMNKTEMKKFVAHFRWCDDPHCFWCMGSKQMKARNG